MVPVITLVIIPDLFYSQARIRFLIDRRFEIRRFGELWLQVDIFTVIYYPEEVSKIRTFLKIKNRWKETVIRHLIGRESPKRTSTKGLMNFKWQPIVS